MYRYVPILRWKRGERVGLPQMRESNEQWLVRTGCRRGIDGRTPYIQGHMGRSAPRAAGVVAKSCMLLGTLELSRQRPARVL